MNLYDDEVHVEVRSVISGNHHDVESLAAMRESDIELIRVFARDDDIQYMRVASTNIGFVRTYEKRFVAEAKESTP